MTYRNGAAPRRSAQTMIGRAAAICAVAAIAVAAPQQARADSGPLPEFYLSGTDGSTNFNDFNDTTGTWDGTSVVDGEDFTDTGGQETGNVDHVTLVDDSEPSYQSYNTATLGILPDGDVGGPGGFTDTNGTSESYTFDLVHPSATYYSASAVVCSADSGSTSYTCVGAAAGADGGTPGGNFTFTDSGGGTFSDAAGNVANANGGFTCALTSGACAVTFTPQSGESGVSGITGIYGGDPTYLVSQAGAGQSTVTGSTATAVVCNDVNPGGAGDYDQCTATVGGSNPAAPSAVPTGTVSWSINSGGTGAFTSGSTCQLQPTGGGANSSSCSVNYGPPAAAGTEPPITATYNGDTNFRSSSGSPQLLGTGGGTSGGGDTGGTGSGDGSPTPSPTPGSTPTTPAPGETSTPIAPMDEPLEAVSLVSVDAADAALIASEDASSCDASSSDGSMTLPDAPTVGSASRERPAVQYTGPTTFVAQPGDGFFTSVAKTPTTVILNPWQTLKLCTGAGVRLTGAVAGLAGTTPGSYLAAGVAGTVGAVAAGTTGAAAGPAGVGSGILAGGGLGGYGGYYAAQGVGAVGDAMNRTGATIMNDPPRRDYKTLVVVHAPKVTAAEKAAPAALRKLLEAFALAQVENADMVISINRLGGATQAKSTKWIGAQARLLISLSKRLRALDIETVALLPAADKADKKYLRPLTAKQVKVAREVAHAKVSTGEKQLAKALGLSVTRVRSLLAGVKTGQHAPDVLGSWQLKTELRLQEGVLMRYAAYPTIVANAKEH